MKPVLTAAIVVLLSACVNTPRYDEVTAQQDGSYAVTRQSIDAFESGDEVERIAAQYCQERQLSDEIIDRKTSYVNSAGKAEHRVTLYFRCIQTGAAAVE